MGGLTKAQMNRQEKAVRVGTRMQAFLAAYEVNLNISDSCKIAGVDRRRFYEWRDNNERFRQDWQMAHENGVERLEREAYRRAVEGLERKRFKPNGDPVIDPDTGEHYIERQYSDRILLALLRRHKPNVYGDVAADGGMIVHHHSGAGASAQQVLETMQKDPDYLEFLRQKALKEQDAEPVQEAEPAQEVVPSQKTEQVNS